MESVSRLLQCLPDIQQSLSPVLRGLYWELGDAGITPSSTTRISGSKTRRDSRSKPVAARKIFLYADA